MAVKRDKQKSKRRLSQAVRSKTRRLRSAVATPATPALRESQPRLSGPTLDNTQSRFADEVLADVGTDDRPGRLPSVMLVITILAILYIVLLAWLVGRMPGN